jgi:prepilin-type N-terminal cleavage/methylation domain-containing protein
MVLIFPYPHATDRDRNRGFSLVELAIGIVILATLMMAIIAPLSAQLELQRFNDTQQKIALAKQALLGFVAAQGRLPCPADNTQGVEKIAVVNPQGGGQCAQSVGYLPASTLGLDELDAQGFLLDGWADGTPERRLRYAVAMLSGTGQENSLTTSPHFNNQALNTLANQLINQNSSFGAVLPALQVCSTSQNISATTGCDSTKTLVNHAVVVIYSLGKNGNQTAVSNDEKQNQDGDRFFVMHTPSDADSTVGEFDDVIGWLGYPQLFAALNIQ